MKSEVYYFYYGNCFFFFVIYNVPTGQEDKKIVGV